MTAQPVTAWAAAIACALWPGCGWTQTLGTLRPATTGAEPQATDEELILTVRANGVERGEIALLRKASGDYWIAARDFRLLKLKPIEQAKRQVQEEAYFSFQALGATGLLFDPAQLALAVEFPVGNLDATRIDLANRPAPMEVGKPHNSAILNYRTSVRQNGDDAIRLRLTTELNVRIGEVLLRQEAKYDTGSGARPFTRGPSQLVWDHRPSGTRWVAGDILTFAGPFGTTFPAAGFAVSRLYAITPDVIRQPTASLQASALSPAEVEVAVDGSTVFRTQVGPGPIALDNLFFNGGARTVRITVTDASGRRQVFEQPFLFTDSVLAQGLHEYSYFIGRRSELGPDDRWSYREGAWQGFHRYGATDSLTLEAGGEGSREFSSGALGATMRHDVFGILALDLRTSVDRPAARRARGWSARYTYLAPNLSLFAGRRGFDAGFRTFATHPVQPGLLSETRLGATTRLFASPTLSVDLARSRDTQGDNTSYAIRLSSNLDPRSSVHAEYQSTRKGQERDWAVNVYLRFDLDRQQWASATFRATPESRGVDLETGKQLVQGEGFGYRAGLSSNVRGGEQTVFSSASAVWNLKPASLEFNGSSQLRGGRSHYLEAAVSGAVVGMDGYLGFTRQVGDGFALARLGVPQPDVDIYLNNQVQGKTDQRGHLLIPQVGAYGRQDVSLDDKQLPMQFNLAAKRITIAPAYKSGTVVDFGGRKLRAVTGSAWLLRAESRIPIASRAWTLSGAGDRLAIETAPAGDFYLEDAAPGRYTGIVEINGKAYSCGMTVPAFGDAVHELQEGIVCE